MRVLSSPPSVTAEGKLQWGSVLGLLFLLATACAASAEEWYTVERWVGRGPRETWSFHIPSEEWRVSWKTRWGEYGPGPFRVYVYRSGVAHPISVVAVRFGEDSGEGLLHGAGHYHLGIETAQPYEISVQAEGE